MQDSDQEFGYDPKGIKVIRAIVEMVAMLVITIILIAFK